MYYLFFLLASISFLTVQNYKEFGKPVAKDVMAISTNVHKIGNIFHIFRFFTTLNFVFLTFTPFEMLGFLGRNARLDGQKQLRAERCWLRCMPYAFRPGWGPTGVWL